MSRHEHIKQFEIETDAVRVLRRARDMIEQGWCQRMAFVDYDDGRQERCASQAISDAGTELGVKWNKAERLFIRSIGCLNNNIPIWNDENFRTKEQVLAAFDKAIRIAQ